MPSGGRSSGAIFFISIGYIGPTRFEPFERFTEPMSSASEKQRTTSKPKSPRLGVFRLDAQPRDPDLLIEEIRDFFNARLPRNDRMPDRRCHLERFPDLCARVVELWRTPQFKDLFDMDVPLIDLTTYPEEVSFELLGLYELQETLEATTRQTLMSKQ